MSLTQLLEDLSAARVELWAEDGELRFRAPPGAFAPDLKARVVARKAALLQRLSGAAPEAEATRFDPFPLTPIQEAYVVGRTAALSLGGVAANSYMEFNGNHFDPHQAETALNATIAAHDMLRTVLVGPRSQRVLEAVPNYRIPLHDLRRLPTEAQARQRQEVRDRLSTKVRDPGIWPLFDLEVTHTDQGLRLHSCVDLIAMDAWSCHLFFAEWFARMRGDPVAAAPSLRFRDVVLDQAARDRSRAETYWQDRLLALPPAPELPAPWRQAETRPGRFHRFRHRMPPARWNQFKDRCRDLRLTPTSALAVLFANVLSCWSRSEDVTLNVTLFNRPDIDPDVTRVLGEFTSTTLVGFDRMDRNFADQVAATGANLLDQMEHSALSGVELLRRLARHRGGFDGSLMPVVFTSLLVGEDARADGQTNWRQGYGISQTPQVTLDHQVYEEDGGLRLNWDVAEAAIDLRVAEAAFTRYRDLVDALADDPGLWRRPVARGLPDRMGAERDRHNPRRGMPAAPSHQQDMPDNMTSLFWQKLDRSADLPAVIWSTGRLSHRELASRAAALAQRLKHTGVTTGDHVILHLDKGPLQVIASLACGALGAVWVPVAPETPTARLHTIAAQVHPRALVADRPGAPSDAVTLAPHVPISLSDCPAPGTPQDWRDDLSPVRPADPAYVIFTSGSTGSPKGVAMSHGAVVNTLEDMCRRFAMAPEDRVFGLSALNFDLAVYDIFAPLSRGAALVLPDPDSLRDPAHWQEMMERHEVTVWNSVPALMQMLTLWLRGQSRPLPQSLRLALLSGDWVPLPLIDTLRALAPQMRSVALGGATEAAIWSNWQDMSEVAPDWPSVPYGRPLSGQYYRVLDRYGADRPNLVPGELAIGGAGLATEYVNDASRTDASFRPAPAPAPAGHRLYHTGDYGLFWPDQTLVFQGRRDQQVKLSGHRIELGEIAHVLEAHPSVRRAVAGLRRPDAAQTPLLCAWVCGEGLDRPTLIAHCRAHLPGYMVPVRLGLVSTMPLSANGKVDAASLATPDAEAPPTVRAPNASAPSASAPGNIETRIHDVLARLLKKRRIARDGNFFELGLSSVDLVEAHACLSTELSVAFPVTDMFAHSTVAALASHLTQPPAAPAPQPSMSEPS